MSKILIIEDEEQVRENIQQILELEGFTVLAAENGLIGVELAKKNCPDLIICDIVMPELDGYAVLAELQMDAATNTIPVIFLSAKADRTDLRLGMELGADDYLTKPFTPPELIKAIAIRLKKRSYITQRYLQQIQIAEKDLDYLTHYDSLTHLPNQLALQEQFHRIQPQADHQATLIPLLLVGLDQFNRINDSFGHAFGDTLIRAVGDRLQSHLQTLCGRNTLAHLRTDQFMLLLNPTLHPQETSRIAQTLINELSQPFELNGHKVLITSSVGIAFYPIDGHEITDLITDAEIAMGQAKQRGGNSHQRYTSAMQVVPSERLFLETCLWQAVEQSEFQVYYQPQLDLRNGTITSAEALVRWPHPERGLISPARFIPLAEETGLIVPLGEWVLRTACAQARAWQMTDLQPIRLAVNLSAQQFSQPNLSQRIAKILAETDLAPQFLDLELTESTLMRDMDGAIATLKALREANIRIAIDDFGIGYSSLGYLQRFPLNTIKIDQCFVRNIDSNPGNAAITQAIVQMAHSLNLKVIAEGVETEPELAILQQQGCDAVQGYLVSHPLSAQAFEQWLREKYPFAPASVSAHPDQLRNLQCVRLSKKADAAFFLQA